MRGRKVRATRPAATSRDADRYVPYPRALRRLRERLDATPEELAAWVFMGPTDGGIAAYVSANEANGSEQPPRFFFENHPGEGYVAALMPCWFRANDIESFEPAERFITGEALIARWATQPGIVPEAFIQAKIEESRLIDLHPTCGQAGAACQDGADDPPLEDGLFSLADIRAIECEDFGSPLEEDMQNPPVGSAEWRSQNAKAAADARHDRPGGSREKRAKMRAFWASGKYTSRDRCAEEECGALGMSIGAARRALENTPDPE